MIRFISLFNIKKRTNKVNTLEVMEFPLFCILFQLNRMLVRLQFNQRRGILLSSSLSVRDRGSVDVIETKDNTSARISSYSSRERVLDSEAEQSSSVVTPTATGDYTFLQPNDEAPADAPREKPEGERCPALS